MVVHVHTGSAISQEMGLFTENMSMEAAPVFDQLKTVCELCNVFEYKAFAMLIMVQELCRLSLQQPWAHSTFTCHDVQGLQMMMCPSKDVLYNSN